MKKLILICLIYSFGQTVNAQTVKETLEKIAEDVVKLNVFIEQIPNKKSVFVGETFFCDYSLIISSELVLTDMKLKKLPSFVPFKSQEVRIETLKFIDTIIDGYSFKKSLLHRYLLTPRNAGEVNIDGIEFEIKVKIPLDAQFRMQNSNFVNSEFYEFSYTVASTPQKININPLPPYNFGTALKPAFIGDFEIDYLLSKITAKKNENILLNINISGIGNLSTPFIPKIEKSEGLKTNIYRTFDTFEILNNEIVSKKTFEVDLISSVAKEYNIFGIEILCFSPTVKEYYFLRTDGITVFFTENDDSKNAKNENFNFLNYAYLVVIIGVIVLVFLIYFYSKHLVRVGKRVPKNKNSSQKNNFYSKENTNSDTTKIYLSKAFNCINGDFDIFLRELNLGIEEYIRERFQIEKDSFSKEQIVQMLEKNGIPSTVAKNYLELSNKIEEVRFSKTKLEVEPENIVRQKLFSFVELYINELEKYF